MEGIIIGIKFYLLKNEGIGKCIVLALPDNITGASGV